MDLSAETDPWRGNRRPVQVSDHRLQPGSGCGSSENHTGPLTYIAECVDESVDDRGFMTSTTSFSVKAPLKAEGLPFHILARRWVIEGARGLAKDWDKFIASSAACSYDEQQNIVRVEKFVKQALNEEVCLCDYRYRN